MKIAYRHLLRFLEDKPDIQELSNKLFQLGHEHDIDNSIFDIEFTPNRGDCLSLNGLARDLNVFYQNNTDLPIYKEELPSLKLNFHNHSQDKCPQISFLNIEIKGDVLQYKDYLEDYFSDLKINKNNFFTDISNYVAYELGQPTHCYDYSLIGDDITLKENNRDCKFITLLGSSIELKSSDLVFTSNEKIINLSGIVGGNETACSNETKSALIECAYFKPESITGKSVKYNLHSEAAHKFERGTDPKCHERVLRRFIQIVSEHVEIVKLELYTRNNTFKDIVIDFDTKKVNKILGTNITKEFFKDSLTRLGFVVDKNVKVPSFRSDINHQNDLAEEVARVVGYDNLPVSKININKILNKINPSSDELIKRFLVDKGFSEVVNFPFCAINKKNSITVDNPLDSNRKYLRVNLTDSLVDNLIYNEKRQKDSIKLFEISDIYTSKHDTHEKRLAIIVSGRRGDNHIDFSKKLDKNYLINLFKEEINFDISKLVSNIDRNKLKTKSKTPIFSVELKIDDIYEYFINYIPVNKIPISFIKYQSISEFPSSYRDLSFSVKDPSKISEVVKTLNEVKSAFIKKSFMFDYYENKKINETKIGFRFIFQSHERTLTDSEVDKIIKEIIEAVLLIQSVTLPKA